MVRLLLGVFGSVFHDLNEFLKLLPCPEQHLIGVFLTHTSRFVAWILFQSIVLDCVVENCRKLVVDALEIGLRVGLAAFIAVAGQRVLPLAHMGRLDLVQRDFLEEGCHLQVDQPFLAGDGGKLEAVFHISDVQFNEISEVHAETARGLADEVTFPLKGFLFGGETALLFMDGSCPSSLLLGSETSSDRYRRLLLLTFLPPSPKNQALIGLFTRYSRFYHIPFPETPSALRFAHRGQAPPALCI